MDAKFVIDFRPISLIGCVYKVVTKILANRLAMVISDLVFDIQSAFVANRQILDGPFIINELLAWCKRKKKQAMIFKVDFDKAYDSVLWDYLLEVLQAFGFVPNWCKAISDGLFKGIQIQGSMAISHPFYADDAVFIGEWSDSNLDNIAASLIGCAVMQNPFRYLGVMVGDSMSRKLAWADTVQKLRSRLSKWKVKTLSIGGRLTLLKWVLGASPLYNMSIYKVPKGVLKEMEAIRCNFFNGADPAERKITWVTWDKFLASKKNGSLGVSSFHALNRALLLKWVWRFLSQDGSLWYRVIQALYGASFELHPVNQSSIWCSILRSVTLSASKDRWICNLNGDGVFHVKEVHTILDDIFLPSAADAMRWVKYIPIKINVFAWRARLDHLPTRRFVVGWIWTGTIYCPF
nr:RNA-directed DNA polymerase, eukaryota [Tanacetum cinerariifolium]